MPENQIDSELNKILEHEPEFLICAINILYKHKDYITLYEFEQEYMETYSRMFSPFLHLDNTTKAIILKTLPYVYIKKFQEIHPILGECTILMVKLHR